MKYLPLAILPAAALGSSVARRTQMSVWDITSPTPATEDPVSYNNGVFTIQYDHGNAGTPFVEIFALPPGQNADTGNALDACKTRGGVSQGKFFATTPATSPGTGGTESIVGNSVGWLSGEQFDATSTILSTYQFSIDASVISAGPSIYIDTDGTPANDPDKVKFCVFFGKTDNFQAVDTSTTPPTPTFYRGNPLSYGPTVTFLEIAIDITFTFDGGFALSDFSTKALDPLDDTQQVNFDVEVLRCPGAPDMYNQLQPIPICICPAADNHDAPLVSIASIQELYFYKRASSAVTPEGETAPPDTVDPISLHAIAAGDPLIGSLAVSCNPIPGDGNRDEYMNYCCQVDVLLGEAFFPPPAGTIEEPLGGAVQTYVALTGDAFLQIGGALDGSYGVGWRPGDPNTRLLRAKIHNRLDRALEVTEAVEADLVESPIEGEVSFVAMPLDLEEESSANIMDYYLPLFVMFLPLVL